jgi:hypothetical protein
VADGHGIKLQSEAVGAQAGVGSKWERFRKKDSQKQKPGAKAGFFVDSQTTRATAYPATCLPGRRARDVMPEAARALVSTVAV